MELRGGVAVHRSGAVVLERGGDPIAGRFGCQVATEAGLHIGLELSERGGDRLAMRLADPVIPADQGRQGHALRGGKRRVPPGAMLHRGDGLAGRVGVAARGLMPNEGLASHRVLALCEARETARHRRPRRVPTASRAARATRRG